ncbi:MAG: 23S rRNA (pseudouridine(1915)-N(3))-methyltransferase RlmH [Clostridia bacterium]|nr:23S rRNA (pseudouridine(1915)-N(3))-methyltransferase RlmH [Clostridia bacterium]
MNVKIICPGKLKEQYLRDMCAEYVKRLGAYCKVNIIELTPERLPDVPSQNEIKTALEKEGRQILSKIEKGDRVVALCIEGRMLSSEQLSEKLDGCAVEGGSCVCFIIGSSCGLSDEVKAKADLRLSMSPMTFPHQLVRVMLLEQVYRAFSISAGSKYHK